MIKIVLICVIASIPVNVRENDPVITGSLDSKPEDLHKDSDNFWATFFKKNYPTNKKLEM